MEPTDLDRQLTEDQALIARTVTEFAGSEVAPRHEALDHAAAFPDALWSGLAELGLFGAFLPEELGGAGAGFTAHVIVVESLARAAGLAGALPLIQGALVDALAGSGHAGAAEPLGLLATGEAIGSAAMVERDPAVIATRAVGAAGVLAISGEKQAVPFPGRARWYLVLALRDGAPVLALVESGAAGLEHRAWDRTLGIKGVDAGTLLLAETPGIALGGVDLVERVVSGLRIAVSAWFGGIMRGALDHATRYAGERKQFGSELARFTAIQERITRNDARVEALRGLVHGAARSRDAGEPHAQAARRARQFAAESALICTDDALQVFGGYGFSREYPAERFYRDAAFPGFGEWVPAQGMAESMAGLE